MPKTKFSLKKKAPTPSDPVVAAPNFGSEWPVYRTRPLPTGVLKGTFLVAEPLLTGTREALVRFALDGIYDRGHEGMVFWAGREMEACTVLLQVIVPKADASAQRVMTSREEVGRVQRAARSMGLGVLTQVHSHPGTDARHSDGDDHLILLPFENMLSIVVPNFGIDFTAMAQARVHQFQEGRWVLCQPESVTQNLIVVPSIQDLR